MSLTRIVNDYKDSVVAASTGANINLSAAPSTLDGVTLAANYRVLVKDQNPSALNGIYRITTLGTGSNGVWTRSSDFNDWREITAGAMVFVQMGAINGNSFYYINGAEGNVTINSTAINFSNLYSLNNNATSFTGNVNIGGNLNVVGNIITNSYETVTLTEYANTLSVTGNISLSNNGNINVAAGGNIYLGNTPVGRFYSANIAPSAPNLGDRWYQGNADILFEYVQDAANNKFWLDLTSNPSSYGNLTVANTLTINGNLSASVTSMNITGGTAGYVLRTDGNGNLSWVAVSATAGGANTNVQFNDSGSIGGATYVAYNKTTGNLYSTSTTTSVSNTTGAITAQSLGISGNVNANAYYSNYYLYSNGNPITTPAGGSNTMVQFNNSGTFTGATYLQYNLTSGNLVSNSTTTSTSTTTGAVVIGGGMGIGGNLYVGGNLSIAGNTTFINTSTITTTDTIAAPIINAGTIGNSGATFSGASATLTGAVQANSYTGVAVYAGTIGNTGATLTGTLSTAAQTNITSVGTLTGLTVSGTTNLQGTTNGATINATTVQGGTIGNTGATFTGAGATFTTLSSSTHTPSANLTYNLGSTSSSWQNLYVGSIISSNGGSSGTSAITVTNYNTYGSAGYAGMFTLTNTYPSATNPNKFIRLNSSGGIEVVNSAYNAVIFSIADSGATSVAGALTPFSNNSVTLGSASAYWSTCYAVTFTGTSTTAKYADLAEMYEADDHYMPGTVMIFGGDHDVTISKNSHDTAIAGVVSTNPAYLMNDNYKDGDWLPIALTGRVPCMVRGPVAKGTLLVSSDVRGVACALDKSLYEPGCIIGKSMDIISDSSIKKIEIAVGRF